MAISRGYRFPVEFDEEFKYQSNIFGSTGFKAAGNPGEQSAKAA